MRQRKLNPSPLTDTPSCYLNQMLSWSYSTTGDKQHLSRGDVNPAQLSTFMLCLETKVQQQVISVFKSNFSAAVLFVSTTLCNQLFPFFSGSLKFFVYQDSELCVQLVLGAIVFFLYLGLTLQEKLRNTETASSSILPFKRSWFQKGGELDPQTPSD